MSRSVLPRAETTRRINDFLVDSLESPNPDAPVALFCECERENCYRPVWMTVVEYRRQRNEGRLLAYGH